MQVRAFASAVLQSLKNQGLTTFFTVSLLATTSAFAQTATTVPQGYITLNIAAGTGTTKTVTPLSIPLLDQASITGQASGIITAVASSTITNSNAGWGAGQLSTASSPYLLRIMSGTATGRTFLLSVSVPNTANTVTIDSTETVHTNLTSLGITTGVDTYEIIPADTLSSLFGTPATTSIVGTSSPGTSDSVVLNINGALSTYYFNSSLNRWTRQTINNPDATNVVVRPDAGLTFSRIGNTPLSFTLVGRVPSVARKAVINNSGTTYLAQGWPVDITLANTGLQNSSNWTSNASVAQADTVQIQISGGYRTYWYDGVNWRRQTINSPISDSQIIPAGANIIINQRGTQTGSTVISQALPYSLN